MKNITSFTLIEVVIVVAILGIMAAVGFPRIIGPSIEKASFSEAVHHLSAYLTAQRSYVLDHGGYAADCNLLDAEVAFKGFGVLKCLNDGSVSVTRNAGGFSGVYTVSVDASTSPPTWTCRQGETDCPAYLLKLLP